MRHLFFLNFLASIVSFAPFSVLQGQQAPELPDRLQAVLEHTQPLQCPRRGRLPLFVLPISDTLAGVDDRQADAVLRQLDERGIGYTVDWSPGNFEKSLAEGLRIGRMQTKLGLRVCVDANDCLYSFFDGSRETLHVDASGKRFADESFGNPLGCPFSLETRVPVIRERVARFCRAYQEAGLKVDFCFADWEIDGPIEWNNAWEACRRCTRCQNEIADIDNFRVFQRRLREIRSDIQRQAFGVNVRQFFPEALVGNYGVYPHGGYRYWYDYFEREAPDAPYLSDQQAKYREWAHEFDGTGYSMGMPVVYTWYPTFGWYDFADLDYRWFYNMLLVGTNAGQYTSSTVPLTTFVHWHTTAPPAQPDPQVRQFSEEKYQDLLWHLLLRGHDAFFLWCMPDELPREVRLVHEVYAAAFEHAGFLERGTPITFDVPTEPASVVSGLLLQDRVLLRRTNFVAAQATLKPLKLADGREVAIPDEVGLHIVPVQAPKARAGMLSVNGESVFPIGMYELPNQQAELEAMAAAGINLVRCRNRDDLDRAEQAGMQGWLPLSVQQGATEQLRQQIEAVADHPALAVWEGPDEIVWTFTAYSFLKEKAGFTRDDWNRQTPKAVDYANQAGGKLLPKMRAGIALVGELDPADRPFWMNEAADSDVHFVRGYVDSVDVIGCDYYAVRSEGSDLPSIGRLVNRWQAIGRGKPVWMVLQGFSWHAAKAGRSRLYPTFAQSRFMAYDAIVHGGRGILYWGTETIDEPAFRHSLYALTSELAALQPFLTAEPIPNVEANLIDDLFDPPGLGVRVRLVQSGKDYLLILVNEDQHRHLGVDVTGLDMLACRRLSLLYGDETVDVSQGGFVTRMQPLQAKIFATSNRYESSQTEGREYPRQ